MGRLSGFRKKEVINVPDGRRLGFVCDADVNLRDGRVEAIVVAGAGKLLGCGKDVELVIPYDRIRRVGEDLVLVDVEERFLRHFPGKT